MFIEKFGEKWNAARTCDLEMHSQKWTDTEMWIEKKWIKENIYYINEKRWNEYVFNAPKNGKAWLINFGHTPFGSPDSDNLFSETVQRSICLARHLGDEFNVGFGDYRKGERVLESYDWEWGQYSKMAPLQIIVKDGKVY